jgi:Flp pilus assembly protein TadB
MVLASFFLATPGWIALLGAIAAMCCYRGYHALSQRRAGESAFRTRLEGFQRESSLADEDMETAQLTTDQTASFLRRLGMELEGFAFSGSASRTFLDALDHRLTLAGNPKGWIATDFLAFCSLLIGGVAVFGGILVRYGMLPVVIYLPLVLLCCGYPYFFLSGATTARKEQAFAELPYFLDQLILGLSSGASTLDAAIQSVVMDNADTGLKDSQRVLVREFRRAYLETANQVKSFDQAYRDAAERIQVQEVDDLLEVFIDANTTGSPILSILQDMSKHVYTVFEQNMATLIKKKDTTFTVATVIIMVSTAILIATPIVLTVIKALSGGLG